MIISLRKRKQMARTADAPEVKAAKALATKIVTRLAKVNLVSDVDDNVKTAKAEVVEVLVKNALVSA
jgi:hypothetical protein